MFFEVISPNHAPVSRAGKVFGQSPGGRNIYPISVFLVSFA